MPLGVQGANSKVSFKAKTEGVGAEGVGVCWPQTAGMGLGKELSAFCAQTSQTAWYSYGPSFSE